MKIRFSAPNDLEVAGSAAELSAIAQQVSQLEAPERFTVSAETNFDPAPYAECLPTLTFAAGSGPVLVLADASGMRIAGSQQHLRSFASFLTFADGEVGTHAHFEYYTDNSFIAPESTPLVITCLPG